MNNYNPDNLSVIIVSEHASARFGGEAILPLHYFQFLRKRGIDAWLVVHERTKSELANTIDQHDQDRVIYTKDTLLHIALWRIGRPLPDRIRCAITGAPMHLATQYMQRKIIRDLVKTNGINVVHEPTPVSPRQPSLIYSVGAPVIIGPMNGGMAFPPAFKGMESQAVRSVTWAGRKLAGMINILIPGKRQASLLLVANDRTENSLPACVNAPVKHMVENGVDLTLWNETDSNCSPIKGSRKTIRFLYMGRMIPLKAINLLIKAFANLRDELELFDLQLDLLGDGSERKKLEVLVSQLTINDSVKFHGFMPQKYCADLLKECDALVMPSLCDCGGAVVLEAMAMAKPVIATDWGGPADYLDDSCGILISPSSEKKLVRGFTTAMKTLAEFPDLGAKLGNSGKKKVQQEYDWEIKIDQIVKLYHSVLVAKNDVNS